MWCLGVRSCVRACVRASACACLSECRIFLRVQLFGDRLLRGNEDAALVGGEVRRNSWLVASVWRWTRAVTVPSSRELFQSCSDLNSVTSLMGPVWHGASVVQMQSINGQGEVCALGWRPYLGSEVCQAVRGCASL